MAGALKRRPRQVKAQIARSLASLSKLSIKVGMGPPGTPASVQAQRASGTASIPTASLGGFVIEGFGKDTIGGQGGDTYHVTSLNDSGAGTLRNGITSRSGARTIVFDLGGTITLTSNVSINTPYLTIDGSTAPSPGITITRPDDTNNNIRFGIDGTHDIIFQYLRFMGNWHSGDSEGQDIPGADGDSSPDFECSNIIIDRCSMQAPSDGGPDFVSACHDITLSRSIMYDGLHPTLCKYATRSKITLHHCVYAYTEERNPQVKGDMTQFDMVNNIIYQSSAYGTRVWDGNSGSDSPGVVGINIVNNVYSFSSGEHMRDSGVGATQTYISGNLSSNSTVDFSPTTGTPQTIPSGYGVTTIAASTLNTMLATVGTNYRIAREDTIFAEIANLGIWT